MITDPVLLNDWHPVASLDQLSQSPLRSPSVFNFFRPGYVPPGTALSASKTPARATSISPSTMPSTTNTSPS